MLTIEWMHGIPKTFFLNFLALNILLIDKKRLFENTSWLLFFLHLKYEHWILQGTSWTTDWISAISNRSEKTFSVELILRRRLIYPAHEGGWFSMDSLSIYLGFPSWWYCLTNIDFTFACTSRVWESVRHWKSLEKDINI